MRKNLVVIMTDDQGYWSLGCAGNKDAHTPNIDKLAQDGVMFENFFCVSPVCSPARASFFTGNIPSAHGIQDWLEGGNIDASKYEVTRTAMYASEKGECEYMQGQMTFPEILQKNGYTCALSGKWHLGASTKMQCGFSKWFSVPLGHSPYIDAPVIENGEVIPSNGFITDMITDRSIEYIKELAPISKNEDKPFYISTHFTAPHSPWGKLTQPADWYEYYKDCKFESVPNEPMHKNSIYTSESPYFSFGAVARDPEGMRQELLSGYFGAIAALDKGVGRIIEELRTQGVLEDTIVIFTSDNGMNCGHHGIWGKGNGTYPQNMYDTSVKVPFIMFGGGIGSGVHMENMYSHYDVFQTVADLLELNLSDDERKKLCELPGRSFAAAIGNESSEDNAIVVFSEYGATRMIRTKKWKYIHYYPLGENELFDIENDPDEKHNLYNAPEFQDVVVKLRNELEIWFNKYVLPEIDAVKGPNTGNGQIDKAGLWAEGRKNYVNSPMIGMDYFSAIGQMKEQFAKYLPAEVNDEKE